MAGPGWRRRVLLDEEAQALPFGAVSMFVLVLFACLVHDTGQVVASRIRMQNTADAAAYSGALVQANGVESIAWTNDAMAYLWFDLSRHAVNLAILGTEAALLHHPDGPPPERRPLGRSREAFLEAFEGEGGYAATATETWQRGRESLTLLGRLGRAVAMVTPLLVEGEIGETALAGWEHPSWETSTASRTTADVVAVAGNLPLYPRSDVADRPGSLLTWDLDEEDLERGDATRRPLSDAFTFLHGYAEHVDLTPDWGPALDPATGKRAVFPNWFDMTTGEMVYPGQGDHAGCHEEGDCPDHPGVASGGGHPAEAAYAYHRTEVCWNALDRGHTTAHGADRWRVRGSPSGHWHHAHEHQHGLCRWIKKTVGSGRRRRVIWVPKHEGLKDCDGHTEPYCRVLGRVVEGFGAGESAIHHAVQRCPTCGAVDHDGDGVSDCRTYASQARWDAPGGAVDLWGDGFGYLDPGRTRSGAPLFYRPLRLHRRALGRGLLVALRLRPERIPWIWFRPLRPGIVATARAAVGIEDKAEGRLNVDPGLFFGGRPGEHWLRWENLYHPLEAHVTGGRAEPASAPAPSPAPRGGPLIARIRVVGEGGPGGEGVPDAPAGAGRLSWGARLVHVGEGMGGDGRHLFHILEGVAVEGNPIHVLTLEGEPPDHRLVHALWGEGLGVSRVDYQRPRPPLEHLFPGAGLREALGGAGGLDPDQLGRWVHH